LDQTTFYPEGGGQPYDTGILGGTEVLEVHEREGRIVHTCNDVLEIGSTVKGRIDWERRFDLMQNHSGEHITSGIAHSKWGCDNVGFHMGSDLITIDLNILLTEEQLKELERDVNRYIQEDHPINITFPSQEELDALVYRSKKALTGQVRIVSFPGADTCACCGTHVSSSGQIGLVKLLSVQKFREGVRIELVSGNRAFAYLDKALEQNRQISNLLSAKIFETGAAVSRLMSENEALKSRIIAMEEHRFAALAGQYEGKGDVMLFEREAWKQTQILPQVLYATIQNCL
jgi:alanyl-tRNA synthetase